MLDKNEKKHPYELNIEKATNAIKEKDYITALRYIKCAVIENQDAPEVHNLLGLIAEFKNDLRLAGKHFRAAYALDPTYNPASRNLDRISLFFHYTNCTNPDYGDMPEEEEISPYVIEYDEMNIRHLRKK